MKTRIVATAVLAAAALVGCGDSDPYSVNNTVTTGEAPKPGAGASVAGGAESRKPAPYPTPKGMRRPDRPGASAVEEATPVTETDAAAAKTEGDDAAPKAEAEAAPAAEASKPEVSLGEAELKEIAKLPAEEQELAKLQKVCLISGEPLGSMGMPLRVEHEGKVGFLCCKGCQADFDKDPAAAIAKVKTP